MQAPASNVDSFYARPRSAPLNARWESLLARLRQAGVDSARNAGVWKTFYRQDDAFAHARASQQALHTFAFEEPGLSGGRRRYLVASYTDFWTRYSVFTEAERHHYEVIPEGSPCHLVRGLYLDLEFCRAHNAHLAGQDAGVTAAVVQIMVAGLRRYFCVACDERHVLDLVSSNEAKFSRHLLVKIPDVAFADNIEAGHFVRNVLADVAAAGDPALLALLQVRNEHGDIGWVVDTGVYTRNRNFRLYLSSKAGGVARPLMLALPSVRYALDKLPPPDQLPQLHRRVFFDSLISCVLAADSLRLLRTGGDAILHRAESSTHAATPTAKPMLAFGALPHVTPPTAVCHRGVAESPFPLVEQSVWAALAGLAASQRPPGERPAAISTRRWSYFPESKYLTLDIVGSRFCQNVQRAHKSNGIYVIVKLLDGVFYQKCYDPDCRGFRSPAILLPVEVNPFAVAPEDSADRHGECEKDDDDDDDDELLWRQPHVVAALDAAMAPFDQPATQVWAPAAAEYPHPKLDDIDDIMAALPDHLWS